MDYKKENNHEAAREKSAEYQLATEILQPTLKNEYRSRNNENGSGMPVHPILGRNVLQKEAVLQ